MRQQLLIPPLAATVLTVAWLFSVPVANAQAQSPSPSPSEQTPKDIPDQKLEPRLLPWSRFQQ